MISALGYGIMNYDQLTLPSSEPEAIKSSLKGFLDVLVLLAN
jgi:hypothetical protein